jgi:hypothetical protein
MFIYIAKTNFKIRPAAAPSHVSCPDLTWISDDQTGARVVTFAQKQAQRRIDELKRADELQKADVLKRVDEPAPSGLEDKMNRSEQHKRNKQQWEQPDQQQLKRGASNREANLEATAEDLRNVQLLEERRTAERARLDRWRGQRDLEYEASINADNERRGAAAERARADRWRGQRDLGYEAGIKADNERRGAAARTDRWRGQQDLGYEASIKADNESRGAAARTDRWRGQRDLAYETSIKADNERRGAAARTPRSSRRDPKRKQEQKPAPKDSANKQKPKRLPKPTPEQIALSVVDETPEVQFDPAKVIIPKPVSETVQEEIEAIRAAYPTEATASNLAASSGSVATSSDNHSPKLKSKPVPKTFVNGLIKGRIKVLERRAGDYSPHLGRGRIKRSLEPAAYAQSILARRRETGLGSRREAVKIIQQFVAKSEPKAEARL